MDLVAWDSVCKNKGEVGLGIHKSCNNNKALLMKLGWNLMENKDSLWVRFLRSKNKCGNDLMLTIKNINNSSNCWNGICRNLNNVKKRDCVELREGR